MARMSSPIQIEDRVLGFIFGGAIGDCLGRPLEGLSPGVEPRNVLRTFSDDTQMTLATCEAIADSKRVDPAVIASTFARWFKRRRITGSGASTRKALIELAAGAHWALSGRGGEMSAGNGAAMRAAPLAFFLDPSSPEDRRTIRDVCRITHRNDEAYAGALAVIIAVRAAAETAGERGTNFVALAAEGLPDTNVRDRLVELAQREPSARLAEIALRYGATGFVVESVPLALFTANRVWSNGFQKTLEELVACGEDADTNASIAGQIMGASIGFNSLPRDLLDGLPLREYRLAEIAQRFADAVAARERHI